MLRDLTTETEHKIKAIEMVEMHKECQSARRDITALRVATVVTGKDVDALWQCVAENWYAVQRLSEPYP